MGKGKNKKRENRKDPIFVECPHCGGGVLVLAIKCGIFRHGTYKDSGKQINPHTTKERCDELVLSLIHISEPTRRTPISYAVFCLKKLFF